MTPAIYRKYRPQTFGQMVGQEYLVEIFKNATKRNGFSHAYLFYGPRGTGKTTAARLIAKAVNCTDEDYKKKQGEPCNKCAACQEIGGGRALDVIEIDAASNRGIDEIRNLKENIRVSPAACKYKVFIIDEAHMLTKEAFNALLKVLEEPPEHAILILATTEYEKVPATIISRTQRYHLRKLTINEIIQKLKMVADKDKLKVNDDALELIAAAAEGSLRDAESLLDQVTALTDKADLKSVESIIGQVGFRRITELAGHIVKSDVKSALRYLIELNETGANMTNLNKELINYFRRALALEFDPRLEEIYQKELTKEEMVKLREHSAAMSADKKIALIKSLIRAYSEMRYSPFPHVPLEVAIIENLR